MSPSSAEIAPWHVQNRTLASPHGAECETVLNLLRYGVALLDDAATVVFSNTTLKQMIRRSCGLQLRAGHVYADSPRCNAELRAAIECCLHGEHRTGAPSTIPIWPAGAAYPTVVTVLPAGFGYPCTPGHGPTVVMLLAVDTSPSVALDDRFLKDAFQLTDAEALVARRLVGGDTLSEIAEAKGISLHTARSQLKSIMLKLGVSRQAELVALLSRCDNIVRTAHPLDDRPGAGSRLTVAAAAS